MEPKRIIAKFDNFCNLGPICMRTIKFSFNSHKSYKEVILLGYETSFQVINIYAVRVKTSLQSSSNFLQAFCDSDVDSAKL